MAISPYSSPSFRGSAAQKHERQVDHFRINSKETFGVSNSDDFNDGSTPDCARSFHEEVVCSITGDLALLERTSTPSKIAAVVSNSDVSEAPKPVDDSAQLSLQQQIEEELFTFIQELEGTYFADQSKDTAASLQACPPIRTGSLTDSGVQHAQQLQRDNHHDFEFKDDVQNLVYPAQAAQLHSNDRGRQQERGNTFETPAFAQLSGHLQPTAIQEARWWNIMEESQRQYVNNPMESDRRGSSPDQPFGNVHADADLRTAATDSRELETYDAEDSEVTSAVLSCIRQLERLRPDQALRVLDSVSHLFEENGYYEAERWHSFPDPRFPGLTPHYGPPQVFPQAPRMIYGALPTPAELERNEFARWSEATPITAPRNDRSNYAALNTTQGLNRQDWSPPAGPSGSRPTTATSVVGATTMSPGSPLQRLQSSSTHKVATVAGSPTQAALPQSRLMEERAKAKAGLPSVSVFFSSGGCKVKGEWEKTSDSSVE